MPVSEPYLPGQVAALQEQAEAVCTTSIAPLAATVDRECQWPAHSLKALAEAGMMGLHVPAAVGGHDQGLTALAVITETLGRACPSSALCYGMHCVGTAVIAAKATTDQQERYLRPIAEGRHITTLALSESGTGVHFYLPRTNMTRKGKEYVVDGSKHFVTNGGYADSYVISTQSATAVGLGEFNCLVLDGDMPGMQWQDGWRGFGMRGNASRTVSLEQVRVPAANRLGDEGDQVWYAFEVVAPYFLAAMAGTYLGVAQTALDIAVKHVQDRHYEHSGDSLASEPVIQHKIATIWSEVQKTRALIRQATQLGDLGEEEALAYIMAAKTAAGETAVMVANEAMTLCGGAAYRDNARLAQCLRDARASHVMSPTTEMLKLWTGRSLLGLPLL